ncbi:MAG: hemin receptor [Chloroflexi bacterium]|nr:hemin receptor [Chloroflexota bacterium]
MLSVRQKTLVQTTFTHLAARSERASLIFYERLFELDPSVRRFFRRDIKEQGRHFMLAVSTAVTASSAPEVIRQSMHQLGQRHVNYGIKLYHFDMMGEAFLYALKSVLGEEYTSEVEEAWAALYAWLREMTTELAYTG